MYDNGRSLEPEVCFEILGDFPHWTGDGSFLISNSVDF